MKEKGIYLLLSIPIIMSLFFLTTFMFMKLKLNGKPVMIVNYQQEFNDPGAVGTILGQRATVKVHGKVNTNQIGTYELVYELENKIGMKRKLTRKVIVQSNKQPTIILKGNEVEYVTLNSNYEEPGYQAFDVEKNDLSDEVTVQGQVNTKEFGMYVIKYEVKDKSGNVTVKKRKVIVKDHVKPVITLKGYQAITLFEDEEYQEPGYQATDNIDKDITNHVIVKNNIKKEQGIYPVTYQVTDSSGNTTKQERQIYVIKHLKYKDEYRKISNVSKGWWTDNKKNNKRPLGGNYGKSLETYHAYYLGENKKIIYLTFDEGGNDTYMKEIVRVLNKNHVKATFFLCQNYIATNSNFIKEMVSAGHSIGNHTHHHKNMPSLATEQNIDEYVKEIKEVEHIYHQITGQEMDKIYREPKGEWSERSLKIASDLGYSTYFWSADHYDFAEDISKEETLNRLLLRYHNGAIYLLHPKNKGNYEALEDFIKIMKKKGYQFGLVKDIKHHVSHS